MSTQSITIIGAGVAGLATGWRLAQSGCRVTIYDKGAIGRGASWAAAGMLAAVIESEPGEDALLPLALDAQRAWPDFAGALEAASSQAIGYRETGTLFIAAEKDDVGVIRQRFDYLTSRGLPVEWLDAAALRRKESCFSPRVREAIFSPCDHQVDNRALTLALETACRKAGVALHPHTNVSEIITKGGRVTALRCGDNVIAADHVILCAGAWSGAMNGLPPAQLPPVFPMKGQMLALQMDARFPLLHHVVWTPHVYLVPRADGRLVVGATIEDKGFDESLTAGGILHLLRETWEALPGIEELPLLECWAGFRPTSRDDAPIFGPSGIEGLSFATGQHRHGILFTPLLAEALRAYICEGALPAAAAPFTMARFQK